MELLDRFFIRIPQNKFPTTADAVNVDDFIHQHDFINSLQVANPALYEMMAAYKKGNLKDARKVQKLKKSLHNYMLRTATKSTPYGLFTTIAHGSWQEETTNTYYTPAQKNIIANLDAEVIQAIVNKLLQHQNISRQLRYFSNNTLYQNNGKYRYYERSQQGGQSIYKLSSVDDSEILTDILLVAANGATITTIIQDTILHQYPLTDAVEFIESLIQEQLLVSELNLTLSGTPNLDRIIAILTAIPVADHLITAMVDWLHQMKAALAHLENAAPADFNTCYSNIKELLQQQEIPVRKVFLQAEAFANEQFELPSAIGASLLAAVDLLGMLNPNFYIPSLAESKRKFLEKFESQAIPLLTMFDPECGIQPDETAAQIENALLSKDILVMLHKKNSGSNSTVDEAKDLIRKKVWQAWATQKYTVNLAMSDFAGFKKHVHRLSVTGQIIFTIEDFREGLISLYTVGNSSGGNLISRFYQGCDAVTEALKTIDDYESSVYKDCIVAEVIHLPDTRMANISFRPVFRQNEIPVYTQAGADPDQVIRLQDLWVTMVNDQFILFSKKHKKRVIPYITNALNYNKNTIALFQFLGDLQFQHITPRQELHLDFPYASFIPRIQLGQVILQKASWNMASSDFIVLGDTCLSTEIISSFRRQWQFPERVEYSIDQEKGLLHWTDPVSVADFLQIVQQHPNVPVHLTEMVFNPEAGWITDKDGNAFNAECIAMYKNTGRQETTVDVAPLLAATTVHPTIRTKFKPGDDWLYIKLYYNLPVNEKLLKRQLPHCIHHLQLEKKIVRFFFLWYKDPEPHLRLRLKCRRNADKMAILHRIRELFPHLEENDSLWRIELDTYTRESLRYGPVMIRDAEIFFEIDSMYLLHLFRLLKTNNRVELPFIALKNIDAMLEGLSYSLEEKFQLLKRIRSAYEAEFKVMEVAGLRKGLDAIEQQNRQMVENLMQEQPGLFESLSEEECYYNRVAEYKSAVRRFHEKFKAKTRSTGDLHTIVSSLIHMHFIRLFPFKPRENELLVYSLLYNYYKKCLYKANQQTNAINVAN
ncbi:thiopeptide-type bacteriocin biosynthesis protein [Chitinophaga dinghuensis]|uniref:Thiopeptide-type bacteriocin biosynthesis protein n=1 Tax=Chitinophaga dinghuensis TaxID=1539050 RepID=A0A327VXX0_9BACT|nr:lantibiotic dehydratase [Chitinophaga dinghuensis]RAJ76602.1 thiopeptide-type bacteriocin biosynthesis protein [Chitinophaga dinghuensis]